MALTDTNFNLKTLLNLEATDVNKRTIEEFGAETLFIPGGVILTGDVDPDPAVELSKPTPNVELRMLLSLTLDVTVPNNQTWRTLDPGPTQLIDWIPPGVLGSYTTQIFDGNDALLSNAVLGSFGFRFTHKTGILTIDGNANAFVQPFKITAYRYIGPKGFATGTAVTEGRIRENISLVGVQDGSNLVFTIPDLAVHNPPGSQIKVYRNGQRLMPGPSNDYVVSESGGVGTGYDTITFTADPPILGERLSADYLTM